MFDLICLVGICVLFDLFLVLLWFVTWLYCLVIGFADLLFVWFLVVLVAWLVGFCC